MRLLYLWLRFRIYKKEYWYRKTMLNYWNILESYACSWVHSFISYISGGHTEVQYTIHGQVELRNATTLLSRCKCRVVNILLNDRLTFIEHVNIILWRWILFVYLACKVACQGSFCVKSACLEEAPYTSTIKSTAVDMIWTAFYIIFFHKL